jgi:hypothetical protein
MKQTSAKDVRIYLNTFNLETISVATLDKSNYWNVLAVDDDGLIHRMRFADDVLVRGLEKMYT